MSEINPNLKNIETGKYAEYLVFAELIKRGADLYLPVIDRGVDAVVRKPDGSYLEIQIKATEAHDQAGYFNVYDIAQRQDETFFVICVDLHRYDTFEGHDWPYIWILTGGEFKQHMTAGHRLPIYEKSRKHSDQPRYKILRHTFKAWDRLVG